MTDKMVPDLARAMERTTKGVLGNMSIKE